MRTYGSCFLRWCFYFKNKVNTTEQAFSIIYIPWKWYSNITKLTNIKHFTVLLSKAVWKSVSLLIPFYFRCPFSHRAVTIPPRWRSLKWKCRILIIQLVVGSTNCKQLLWWFQNFWVVFCFPLWSRCHAPMRMPPLKAHHPSTVYVVIMTPVWGVTTLKDVRQVQPGRLLCLYACSRNEPLTPWWKGLSIWDPKSTQWNVPLFLEEPSSWRNQHPAAWKLSQVTKDCRVEVTQWW